MWAYIIAAARGDSRRAVHKRPASADSDDNLYMYRDGKVFTIPSPSGPRPGTSGMNSRDFKSYPRNKAYPKKILSPQILSPLHMHPNIDKIEEGIEPFEEVVSDVEPGRSWIGTQFSRLMRSLRYRISGEGRTIPPDWFLDKFAAETFNDPEEPLYQAKRSKFFCGLRLAFDPTLPAHYHRLYQAKRSKFFCGLILALALILRCLRITTLDLPLLPFCIINGSVTCSDWFLFKFAAETFNNSEEPLYQANRSNSSWLAVVSLAILYNMVFVIGRAVFWELDDLTLLWYVLDYLCDTIYLMDTVVHMHEGYLEQGLMVKDSEMLRDHYLSTDAWRYDVISLLPTDIAYYWWTPGSCSDKRLPCPVIVRLNRLVRLPRMWEWFDRTETATSFPNAFRICKVVMAILVLIHWNACLYFVISYAIGFGVDNWVYNITGVRNETLAHQYIYSFYWSTLTLTTIGETPQPENDAEYVFVVADFLAGVLIFATIVGNIGSMISNMNVARVEFQNKMDGVKQYMAFRKVSGELEARVIRWFAYTWAESGALDEETVLSSLPDKLKAEIAIRVHLDTLRKVEIFKDCEPGLLEALVLKLRLQVFSPGDYICRKGDVGKEMYIVKRGRLQVVADDGKTVLATLSAGSVFGEVSVLEIAGNRTGNRRTANVRALGYSDLFCLAKRDLWEALGDYPDAMATLTERGCQLLRKDGLLDENVFENAQTTQQSMEDTIRKLESTVETLEKRLQGLLTDVGEEQAKMKQRINKIATRIIESDDEQTDQDYDTSDDEPDLQSEIARSYDSYRIPLSPVQCSSRMSYIHHRERGHSLSVERTPGLLRANPEPRSKSLRVKRFHKDPTK